MRRFIIISIFLLTISCNNDDDFDTSTVIGTWEINARLADPGDGSGTFQPLQSGKTLAFSAIGSVIVSKGTLCGIANDEDGTQSGRFNTSTSLITVTCEGFPEDFSVGYELKDGNLMISYPCIEGCAERYQKIAD